MTPHTIFMKDTCTISAKTPASPLLTDRGDTIIAVARYGKGTVFATVDPWLYNEYTDGHRLPASYDNYSAAKELVRWILSRLPLGSAWFKRRGSGGTQEFEHLAVEFMTSEVFP